MKKGRNYHCMHGVCSIGKMILNDFFLRIPSSPELVQKIWELQGIVKDEDFAKEK